MYVFDDETAVDGSQRMYFCLLEEIARIGKTISRNW